MRSTAAALLLAGSLGATLTGCGGGDSPGTPGTNQPDGPPSFTLTTPSVQIDAGQEVTYCYFFHTSNTQTVSVKQLASTMPITATSVAVVLTETDLGTPGTIRQSGCALAPFETTTPVPVYLATEPSGSFTFPTDDGSGKPVGLIVPANQSGYVRIHFVNPTEAAISASAEIEATGYDTDVAVTRADPFVSFNGNLDIPPSGIVTASQDCPFPNDVDVFALTMHAHKQAVHMAITDASTILFESDDFSNPGGVSLSGPPFIGFTSGTLTTRCDYVNPTPFTIRSGDSEATDETCMGIAWYFPSVEPTYCFDGTII